MRPRLTVATEIPAAMGWWVANQVRAIATASSALLRGGFEVRACSLGHQGGGGERDKGVQRVPDQIEAGDFVCEEFAEEEERADTDDPRILERAEVAGQNDPMQAGHDAERTHGRVDVESGGEA